MKKSFFWMACLGACALALAACGKERDVVPQAKKSPEIPCADGKGVNAEPVKEKQAEAPEASVNVHFPAVCYYTEKGGKWHTDIDCRYLKNSAEIRESGVEGARFAGKNMPCSICAAAYIER